MAEQDGAVVSVEQDGRTLSGGAGSDPKAMTAALEQSAPDGRDDVDESSGRTGDAPATAETAPSPSKSPRGAKRFDQLTSEREQARREAQDATQRALALESRLAALETRQAVPPTPTAEPLPPVRSAAAPSAGSRPKPQESDVGAKYPTYADFVEDLSDWKAEQRISQLDLDGRVRQGIETDRASRSLADRWQQTTLSARALYPDFDAVLSSGPGVNIALASDPVIANERVHMLINTPGGEHVIYKLAKDAAETQRLSRLSDRDFGFAIARLLPADASIASPASMGVPRAVSAPAPYQPVGAGGKTTASTLDDTTKRATVNGTIDYDAGPREFFNRQRQGGRRSR